MSSWNKKPTSLDSVTMCSINTTIACHGMDRAEQVIRDWHTTNGFELPDWVPRYVQLYVRYCRKKDPCDNYIDVEAAIKALAEA